MLINTNMRDHYTYHHIPSLASGYLCSDSYQLPAVCTVLYINENVMLASVHKEKIGDQVLSQKKSCYRGVQPS